MAEDVAEIVEQWFTEHNEDEFVQCPRELPYHVIGPTKSTRRIVYVTKPSIVLRAFDDSSAPEDLGIIARYGLPNQIDLDWLSEIVAERELLFLGDMDPVDIMIFAWLRKRMNSTVVSYFGISDEFISELSCRMTEAYRIQLGPSETAAITLLEGELLELQKPIGPACFELLKKGFKIELEAVVSALGAAAPIFKLADRYRIS